MALVIVIACADGGSNILYDSIDKETDRYIPDFVCGDLDSARKEVVEYFQSNGCSIVKYPSQDSTDCTKTLHHLIGLRNNGKFQFSSVYILNGIGGRFDQTLANINTLYSVVDTNDISLYLMSEDSLLFILEPTQSLRKVTVG